MSDSNAAFTGKDMIADRGFAAQPVYLADLDRCTPAGSLSPDPKPRHWRTMTYEADDVSGVMLMAGPETAAPDVRYPLGVSGWHAVSVGILGDRRTGTRVLARLSRDDTFSILTLPPVERTGHGEQVKELFWKTADLTDQELVLGQMQWRVADGDGPGSFACTPARVVYIKLVPLSDAETRALQSDREDDGNRRLFAHNDAHGPHYGFRPTDEEEIRRHLEPYRDNDFSRLYWEIGGGDTTFYFSKIGVIPAYDGLDDFGRQGDRMQGDSWRILRSKGIDPLRVAVERTHEMGLELHAGYRLAGFLYPAPLDHFNQGTSFYAHHPHLRAIDRNGNETPRISYSFPETRRFALSLLREVAAYDVDGIALLYNRRPPLVEYEPPLIEGFMAEYGEDPRQLDEMDRRWLTYRARTLTQFMGEVREAMDQVAEGLGRDKRIEITAVTMKDEEENLVNGMDVKAWVDGGLVDTLIAYTSAPNLSGMDDSWLDVSDSEWFISLTKGTSCRLALNLMPRYIAPEDYRRRAAALYDAGVEHLFFWDSDASNRAHYSDDWNALRRLGHGDEIAAWQAAGEPSLALPSMALTKLGDWDLSYVSPG